MSDGSHDGGSSHGRGGSHDGDASHDRGGSHDVSVSQEGNCSHDGGCISVGSVYPWHSVRQVHGKRCRGRGVLPFIDVPAHGIDAGLGL